MSISVSSVQETGYRSLKVKGTYSLSNFQALADRIHAESLEHNCKNFLLDVSEVIGTVPVMHRFFLAEYVSKLWGTTIRVAIVYRAEDISKLFENAAVNRSVNTIVVPDVKTALKWLLGGAQSQPSVGDGK
jgi:hypothetical protein